MKRSILIAAVVLGCIGASSSPMARAALVDFCVAPNADQVVDGEVDSDGTGAGWLRLNPGTNAIEWSIIYSNLTGDPTMAHFHGPAEPGENAGAQVALDHTQNPMIGSANTERMTWTMDSFVTAIESDLATVEQVIRAMPNRAFGKMLLWLLKT